MKENNCKEQFLVEVYSFCLKICLIGKYFLFFTRISHRFDISSNVTFVLGPVITSLKSSRFFYYQIKMLLYLFYFYAHHSQFEKTKMKAQCRFINSLIFKFHYYIVWHCLLVRTTSCVAWATSLGNFQSVKFALAFACQNVMIL